MRNYTYAEKIQALKGLVKDAATEQRGVYLRGYRDANAPEFNPAGFQKDNVMRLVSALENTEALYILDEILNGVDSGE